MSWKEVKKARGRLSREQGAIVKDWGGRLPVAVVYPNRYYVGMSNLGLHVLYSLFNSHREVVCERAFWEKEDWNRLSPTLSVESQRPLSNFAVLAFTVSYELDYFNVVQILKANGIPLYAAERDGRHPLVIAGGPCIIANPMPLSPFLDCMGIGEAESIVPSILPIISSYITGQREILLKTLASVPGIYVPRYYSGTPVARQWVNNLDDFPVASAILTPDTELGDLYLIEVERGCTWGCLFCLTSPAFRPMRYRSPAILLEQAKLGLKYGKRLGLVGADVSDHPQIEEILLGLRQLGAEISVSSLRVKPLPDAVLEEVAQGGAKTITLAPEAGSQRLRDIIKKGISEGDILDAVNRVANNGIRQLKLYFIVGLPSETEADIEAIIRLTKMCKEIMDKQYPGSRIALNIAPFVPKAGTPFQWFPMAPLDTIQHRLSLLKSALSNRGVKLKIESPAWSQVQAVLSRGDTKLAEVLANIDKNTLSGWRQAAEKYNLDINYYAHQRWNTEQGLPWDAIDSGVTAAHLESELFTDSSPT
ncbi:B12-binding domain-containing radical SAM protein [Chloroflexota bacterium]